MAKRVNTGSRLTADLVADLGSSNIRFYAKGSGLVLDEPSVIAVSRVRGKTDVKAVGLEAAKMAGRAPAGITVISPIQSGIVVDVDAATMLVAALLQKAGIIRAAERGGIVALTAGGSTPVERRLLRQVVSAAGARHVMVLESCFAGALGAGLPVSDARGALFIDIGGGTCDVAIVALGGIGYTRSTAIAGQAMDAAIVNYLHRQQNLRIGLATAEQAKRQVGSAFREGHGDGPHVAIHGQDLARGIPCETMIYEADIAESLIEPITGIFENVKLMLDHAGQYYGQAAIDGGIWLSGGTAQLRNLNRVIEHATGVPVHLVGNPLTSALEGAGLAIENELVLPMTTEN